MPSLSYTVVDGRKRYRETGTTNWLGYDLDKAIIRLERRKGMRRPEPVALASDPVAYFAGVMRERGVPAAQARRIGEELSEVVELPVVDADLFW